MRAVPNRDQVLAFITEHPKRTRAQIAAELDMPKTTAVSNIRRLHAAGAIRVGGWFRNYGTRGQMAPKWVVGDGKPDTPRPRPDKAADARRFYARNRVVYLTKQAARRGTPINHWMLLLGMR